MHCEKWPSKDICTNYIYVYTEIDGWRNFCASEQLNVHEFCYHATQLLLIISAGARSLCCCACSPHSAQQPMIKAINDQQLHMVWSLLLVNYCCL